MNSLRIGAFTTLLYLTSVKLSDELENFGISCKSNLAVTNYLNSHVCLA